MELSFNRQYLSVPDFEWQKRLNPIILMPMTPPVGRSGEDIVSNKNSFIPKINGI
jgi:hypothetical protein